MQCYIIEILLFTSKIFPICFSKLYHKNFMHSFQWTQLEMSCCYVHLRFICSHTYRWSSAFCKLLTSTNCSIPWHADYNCMKSCGWMCYNNIMISMVYEPDGLKLFVSIYDAIQLFFNEICLKFNILTHHFIKCLLKSKYMQKLRV